MLRWIQSLGVLLWPCVLALGCAPSYYMRDYVRGTHGLDPQAESVADLPPTAKNNPGEEAPKADTVAGGADHHLEGKLGSLDDLGHQGPTTGLQDLQPLVKVIGQLEATGAISVADRQQLVEDLKQTDPALRPQLLEYFSASLRYRQRAQQQAAAGNLAQSPDVAMALAGAKSLNQPITAKFRTTAANEKPEPSGAKSAASDEIPPPERLPSAKPAESERPVAAAAPATPVADTTPMPKPEAPARASAEADWRAQLSLAAAQLEGDLGSAPKTTAEIGQHASLRMLYLIGGRRDDALRPIPGVSPVQQDFWSKEIYGLASYLDADRNPDAARRAAEANGHLREASAKLGELALLSVKNLTFCSEVLSYGDYKKFDKYEFEAGQQVLLYAELENFKSEGTERGFHTALKASYQILDQHGARVAEHEFKTTEEYCRAQRRDFFTNYLVWLPPKIYGGAYTLQLTIEDLKSQKIGQASIEFKIKDKP